MGKRKRHNEVSAEAQGRNPVKGKGRDAIAESSDRKDNRWTRKKREATASPANKENLVAGSSQKVSRGRVVKAGKGRNHVTGRAAACRFNEKTSPRGGESGAKKPFNWSSAQEIIILSELVKSMAADTCQSSDRSTIDWVQLAVTVGKRLDHTFTRSQIYEKARRLKERYIRTQKHQEIDNSFKNEDEEKMYKLSEQIWGTSRAIRSKLEEECDVHSDHSEKKLCDVNNIVEGDTLPDDAEVEIPMVFLEEEHAPNPHQKDPMSLSLPKQGMTVAYEQANPDSNFVSQSNIHAIAGDTRKTFEIFRTEHQALLKELEKSCTTVLQDLQVKVLSMMNESVRGSQFPWMGGCVPSFESITQAPLLWNKLVDTCLSTSTNKPAAFENLYEEWQQQRLQELKLISVKLQLMLENCKIEQEKLEKQMLKS